MTMESEESHGLLSTSWSQGQLGVQLQSDPKGLGPRGPGGECFSLRAED